jgi:aminoglycoside phosphotransferase (APT) family kinase protein
MAHDLAAPAPTGLIATPIPGEVLAAVPGCESGAPPLGVQVLAGGGGHNDVRLVETRMGRFVVRRRLPPVVRAGSDAMLELQCQRLAARHGLAPKVMAAAGDASWLVMEFIPGNPWVEQDLTSATGARRLGECLARVHAMPVASTMRRMDAAQIASGQLRAINATVTSKLQRDEAAAIARRTSQLAAVIQSDVHPCINHGDLQASNLIGNPPVLIDWEYAQIASPAYDIACVLAYYPQLKAWRPELLAASGLARAEDLEHLALQEQLFAGLNRLWALANDPANNAVSGLGAG